MFTQFLDLVPSLVVTAALDIFRPHTVSLFPPHFLSWLYSSIKHLQIQFCPGIYFLKYRDEILKEPHENYLLLQGYLLISLPSKINLANNLQVTFYIFSR
jgi:hypothetical protein